ncbi:MAG: GspH/FimT family pseudopilin [Gammaproteobacteria bacterium]|nr:GspH/FimT family pseudopilin [Gammaproteobacteria bacterium]
MTKNHGFTLIELIITLAVVSIVLMTGIPALNQMTDSNRLVTQINSIAGSLALARSEAIKTGSVVTVCASSDAATCNVDTWESGWIVFTDKNKDNAINSSTDYLIKIQGQLNGGTTLRLSNYDVTGIYQFLPDGSSRDRDLSGTSMGTFTLCNKEAEVAKAKAINVNFIGRTTRAEDNGGNKIVEDVTGITDAADVTCP